MDTNSPGVGEEDAVGVTGWPVQRCAGGVDPGDRVSQGVSP